jgi:cell division protein FtsA
MNSAEPIGIIELDNVNLKCFIFKIKEDNNLEILSTSVSSSNGIHNDVIVNLEKASSSIRACVSACENKAKVSLKKINVVFEQIDFLCTKFSKHKKINGSKIHKDDIEFMLKEAKKQLIQNDRNQHIVHIFNHNYIVDNKIFEEEPIGVFADSLTHEMSFITTTKNNLKNIRQAFMDCDLEVERFFSRTFSLGAQLLNSKEMKQGFILLDLGFEKVSLGLFKNLALVHSATFPIGTNHIRKDISKVCSLNLKESNNIINDIDFSFNNNKDIFNNNYLKESYFIDSNFRKISEDLILDVIKSRLDEIIKTIKSQLILPNFNLSSASGISLTGEGANLNNIEGYFSNFFQNNPIHKNNIEIDDKHYLEKHFTACLGAAKIFKDGWETEAIPKTTNNSIEKTGFFAKIFGIRS